MNARLAISGVFALALLFGITLMAWTRKEGNAPPILLFVLLAALLGRGIEITSRHPPAVADAHDLKAYVDLAWELLVSMIFALVIYLMFQGRILQGSLFPQFSSAGDKYTNMYDYMRNMRPATNVDTAKALFWAFVAGYSAKFVPRLLSGVSKDTAPPPAKPR